MEKKTELKKKELEETKLEQVVGGERSEPYGLTGSGMDVDNIGGICGPNDDSRRLPDGVVIH